MSRFLPPAASAHATDVDVVLTLVHVLMGVLFVGWSIYFAWVLLRFRAARHPRADHSGARGRLTFATEVGVVVAEVILLVGFALPMWFEWTAEPSDRSPETTEIRVVAEQFAWNAHYPGADGEFGTTSAALITATNPLGLDRASHHGADDVVVVNQVHVPIGRPVVVRLSSKDVVHSFGIPAMRVKQDAIPGSGATVVFTPTVVGQYEIACSQLCGLAHFRMRGVLTVESAEAFQEFLARER